MDDKKKFFREKSESILLLRVWGFKAAGNIKAVHAYNKQNVIMLCYGH